MLHNDDGETAPLFEMELKEVADSLLRRARWDQTESRWPSMEEIKAMARNSTGAASYARRNSSRRS